MKMPVLSIRELAVSYDDFELNIPSLELHNGEVIGFIGANGAGKSTTINAIMRIIDFDKGEIFYSNALITDNNIDDLRMKIGYVGEYTDFYYNQKAKHIIRFVSKVYKNWDNQIADYYINDMFKINLNKKIKELSDGTKTKLALAIALSHHPEVLILDEPTSGLDPIIREEILTIINDFVKKSGKMAFFSSHITQDIEKIADRIIFIVNGKIILDIKKDEAKTKFIKIPIDKIDKIKSLMKNAKIYNDNVIVKAENVEDKIKDLCKPIYLEDILFYLNGGI